ncbi:MULTISPECIES: hypothetical protein [unclassified Mameliella]|uniref:hypothetical protein n=1 Tax=unclassified Mameliella TaxID=2630630 RepID=UPI00273D092C|nr:MULTISPECIES: hypothetical protein [unclassified Mameliella]
MGPRQRQKPNSEDHEGRRSDARGENTSSVAARILWEGVKYDSFLSNLLVKLAEWRKICFCLGSEVWWMVKAIRIFRCSCNHRLRYGVSTCRYCFNPTPIWNRWWLPLVLLAMIGAWIWIKNL